MLRIRLSKQLLLVATAALALTGCPDPDGTIDEFVGRTEEARKIKDAAASQGFFDASGRYFLSLAASVDSTKPVLFDANIVVDAEAMTIQINMHPLSVEGRMTVGDVITHTPVPISAEGKFDIDFGEITIHGDADPLLPGQPIVAMLTFSGQTNSMTEVCGSADGMTSAPAPLALAGSTFGALLAEDGMFADLVPLIGCTEEE